MEHRDVEIQLTRLATVMEQGFETTQREVRELKDYQREMNGKVGRAYERLAGMDKTLEGHDREFAGVRKRLHDLSQGTSLENMKVTWKAIGQALAVIGGAGGGMWFFLTSVLGYHR